jgi:uncharacterized membrane protein YfcA
MSVFQIFAVLIVAVAAGTMNTIVGSGSLVTFPTLLAVGLPARLANMSNTVGLVPGGLSGVHSYRRELVGQKKRLIVLTPFAAAGGILGAMLLLELSGSDFRSIVPALILVACVLVGLQPHLSRWVTARGKQHAHGGGGLYASMFLTAIYGGYFGAAQGVILISLLGVFIDDDLQRLNAAKNYFVMVQNGVAALLFIALGHVAWEAAGMIAAGSVVGGQLGGRYGRRLDPRILRILIIVVGLTATTILLI